MSSRQILVIGFTTLALITFRLLAQVDEMEIGDGFSLTNLFSESVSSSKLYAFWPAKLAGELGATHNRDPMEVVVL